MESSSAKEAAVEMATRWGYTVRSRSEDCLLAIDSYYEQVLTYGRRRAVILEAVAHDPACTLVCALAAHFLASRDPPRASSLLATASATLEDATPYERAVFKAISCLVGEDRDEDAALQQHHELLKEFPKDLVSLKHAQLLCFYLGRPDLSRTFVEQVLPQNQDQEYVYGMLAFALLELGRMDEAERAGRKGYELNKGDVWSQHAICHVFQYECRFKEAVDFMEAHSSSWISCSSFMYTHNWWHVAVCYLEGHSPLNRVLEVYDNRVWKELERTDAECGEVYVNALGLLLRIDVRDRWGCIQDRLRILATRLKDESTWHMEWLLDILALWALARTSESHKAENLLKSLKSRVGLMNRKKQDSMQRGLQLAEAIYEYGRDSYQKVVELLGPDFDATDYRMIGASDEQVDVFNEVWLKALLITGNISKAIDEIEKRIQKRDGVPFLWHLLGKAYTLEGRADAQVAVEKAKTLEAAYFD